LQGILFLDITNKDNLQRSLILYIIANINKRIKNVQRLESELC